MTKSGRGIAFVDLAQHRTFHQARFLRLATLALFLAACALQALAQTTPQPGTDYRPVSPAQPTESPGKIEVIEFFWYGCPHCYSFEPGLNDWIKRQGPDVTVRRVPVAFRDSLVPHQRLYFALDALGKEKDLRSKVFYEMHVNKNYLENQEAMANFVEKNGIDRKKFLDAYNSFAVQTKSRRASQTAQAYGVDGVPAMGVNGKYLIPASTGILRTVDSLVASERTLLKPASAPVPAKTRAAVKP